MKNNTQQKSGANAVGHKGIVSAVVTGLSDLLSNKGQLPEVDKNLRIDGKTCLITGASSGLGKAVAIDLARRGGNIILVCRKGHQQVVDEIKQAASSSTVQLLEADLADTDSIHQLCNQLQQHHITLDIAVLNAGLMPLNARKSAQGYEVMFAVHFLANRLLLKRWMQDGVIVTEPKQGTPPARVIFVSSEAHQSSDPIDFENLAQFHHYGMKDGMKYYGYSKLHLSTFAQELSRRANPDGKLNVAVHSLCPGPINSNIARESPAFIRPILSPIMKLLFRSPQKAAEPVIYLACVKQMGQRTGAYLHMMREKAVSPLASDPQNGEQLWRRSEQLLQQHPAQKATAKQGEATCL